MPDLLHLEWSGGVLAVSPLAGMLTDLRFDLPSGPFRPLAPLTLDADPGLPGHLRGLGGEFSCVPFGSSASLGAPGWPAAEADDPPHGHGADATWAVLEPGPDQIVLSCDHPAPSPVRRLQRTVRPIDATAVTVELVVEVRRPVALPIGMHPILRLPERGGLVLDVDFTVGFTAPTTVHATSPTATGRRFHDLTAVPAASGGTVDLHRLPLGPPMEDVVLLAGARSPARVHVEEADADLVLTWDDEVLPSMLLWCSDRALTGPPWHGRYRGIGLEPVAAALDLPVAVSTAPNPVAEAGFPTSVGLDPDRPLELGMVLRAEPSGARSRQEGTGPR